MYIYHFRQIFHNQNFLFQLTSGDVEVITLDGNHLTILDRHEIPNALNGDN